MTESALHKIKNIFAKRKVTILASSNPQNTSIEYLKKSGYLDENGDIAPNFKGGIQQQTRRSRFKQPHTAKINRSRKRALSSGLSKQYLDVVKKG